MPNFNIGREHLDKRLAPKSSSGSSTKVKGWINFMRLKAGESEYVKFLTGIDDVADVSIHRMVKVAQPNPAGGTPKESWTDFVDREPGVFDDGDGTDWQQILKTGVKHKPQKRITGLVAVLEPVYKKGSKTQRLNDVEKLMLTGRYFTKDDGETIFYPAYQLAFQSEFNFWNTLRVHDDEVGPIDENPFKIIRDGGDTNTTYIFNELKVPVVIQGEDGNPTDEAVDWNNLNIPTLPEVLEELGSHDRYQKYFGDESLWREQPPFARPDYVEGEETTTDETEEDEGTESKAFKNLKEKAATYK